MIGHVVFFTWHTDRAAQAFNRSTVPANTIEGIPEPRFFLETDSYAWLSHTRDLMKSDDWRLRWTFMDNAPYGREMHWSHLMLWTMSGMANGIMAATGWPLARGIELAGVWIMPLFQVIFLFLAIWAIGRKMGLVPSACLTFVFLTFECVSISFFPLEPDHHALQMCFILFSFVCLQFGGMGWTTSAPPLASEPSPYVRLPAPPGIREAHRWFIASGIFGGLALWVGATVWLIALAVIALAMLPALPLFQKPDKQEIYAPALWRWWALAGMGTGLACYLLEYAPNHFAMRLEVNHPFYWLSWLGVALGLEQLAKFRRPLPSWPTLLRHLWLPALLSMALPLAIFFGPEPWHQMHHPFLQRLHEKYIVEFQSSVLIREGNALSFLATFRSYLLALIGTGLFLLLRRTRTPHEQRLLACASLYAALFFAAAMCQQRWGFLLAAALVWVTVIFLSNLLTPGQHAPHPFHRLLGGLLLLLILLDGVYSDASRLRLENNISNNAALPESWIANNVKKRNALRWGLAMGTNQWRFAGMAPEAPLLYYYSGIPSVASYYWENAAGWQAEATMLADTAPNAEQALSIARERDLTHIISVTNSSYPEVYAYIATGTEDPVYAALHTLDGHLTYPPFTNRPPWIAIDESLSEIGKGPYIFKTPAGYAREWLRYQVFSIQDKRGKR